MVAFPLWNNPSDFLASSNQDYPLATALSYGTFQAVSGLTSTGYTIINYDYWPYVSQFIMLILMYIGGMSGSTAGGVKVIRFLIVLRVLRYKIETFFHRDVFRVVKVGDREITDRVASTVLSFFASSSSLSRSAVFF